MTECSQELQLAIEHIIYDTSQDPNIELLLSTYYIPDLVHQNFIMVKPFSICRLIHYIYYIPKPFMVFLNKPPKTLHLQWTITPYYLSQPFPTKDR